MREREFILFAALLAETREFSPRRESKIPAADTHQSKSERDRELSRIAKTIIRGRWSLRGVVAFCGVPLLALRFIYYRSFRAR